MKGAIAFPSLDLSHAARELAAAAMLPAAPAASAPLDEPPSLAVSSVLEVLRRRALHQPGTPALTYAGASTADAPGGTAGHLGYGDLYAQASRTRTVLREFGISPGDPVAVILPLMPQTYPALLGALGAGIVQPVNPLLSAEAMAEQLRASRAKAVFALGPTPGWDLWERTALALRQTRSVDLVLQVNGTGHAPDWLYRNGRVNFDALVCGAPTPPADAPVLLNPARTAVLTTRTQRGTVHLAPQSHQALMRQLRTDDRGRGWKDGARIDVGRPLFHVAGALGWALLPLAKGMRATVSPELI